VIVGCYSLHLYCDDPRHVGDGPAEITGNDRSGAYAEARIAGWMFKRGGETCICKRCRALPKQRKEPHAD
jgi:hypothetical protein